MPTALDRFMAKVQPEPNTGCWLWDGALMNSGYGAFRFRGGTHTAHRVSWTLHRGEIPEGDGYHGTCVLHRCDVRCCVNPDHLFLGTNEDNVHDMFAKGRQSRGHHPRGERHSQSRLTRGEVLQIVRRRRAGETGVSVAKDFAVTPSAVGRIMTGRAWSHVTGIPKP